MPRLPDDFLLTQKEYFLLDESRGNLEYWAGRIVILENNTARHGRIIMNLGALAPKLSSGCGLMTNVGVRAGHRVHFLKPDLMIVCGREEFFNKRQDIITNPKVIVEVLSSSTEGYDKREKLRQYRTIQTLQEYVLISQAEPKVYLYKRENGEFWSPREISDLDHSLHLESVKAQIKLAEIYRGLQF